MWLIIILYFFSCKNYVTKSASKSNDEISFSRLPQCVPLRSLLIYDEGIGGLHFNDVEGTNYQLSVHRSQERAARVLPDRYAERL